MIKITKKYKNIFLFLFYILVIWIIFILYIGYARIINEKYINSYINKNFIPLSEKKHYIEKVKERYYLINKFIKANNITHKDLSLIKINQVKPIANSWDFDTLYRYLMLIHKNAKYILALKIDNNINQLTPPQRNNLISLYEDNIILYGFDGSFNIEQDIILSPLYLKGEDTAFNTLEENIDFVLFHEIAHIYDIETSHVYQYNTKIHEAKDLNKDYFSRRHKEELFADSLAIVLFSKFRNKDLNHTSQKIIKFRAKEQINFKEKNNYFEGIHDSSYFLDNINFNKYKDKLLLDTIIDIKQNIDHSKPLPNIVFK